MVISLTSFLKERVQQSESHNQLPYNLSVKHKQCLQLRDSHVRYLFSHVILFKCYLTIEGREGGGSREAIFRNEPTFDQLEVRKGFDIVWIMRREWSL